MTEIDVLRELQCHRFTSLFGLMLGSFVSIDVESRVCVNKPRGANRM